MALINIGDLKEGMIVAKPVLLQQRVVLGEGAAITPRILQLLKTWGVTEVNVQGDDAAASDDGAGKLTEAELASLSAPIELRFKRCSAESEPIKEIKRLLLKRAIAIYERSKVSS